MVIASIGSSQRCVRFDHWRSAKLAAPNDQRRIEHSKSLQVLNQSNGRLLGRFEVPFVIAYDIRVRIPAFMINVDEADTTLDHSTRQQTCTSKRWLVRVTAYMAIVSALSSFKFIRLGADDCNERPFHSSQCESLFSGSPIIASRCLLILFTVSSEAN